MTRIRSLKHLTLGTALATAALAAGLSGAHASAITFDPAGSSPALTTAGNSQFMADTAFVADYSSINVQANGNFTESGILPITAFGLNGSVFEPAGFSGQPGATPPYGLYFRFQGSGTGISGGNGAGSSSKFDTLTFALYGDLGNSDGGITVAPQPTGASFANSTSKDVLLGGGRLISGDAALNQNTTGVGPALLPTANAVVSFAAVADEKGFFPGLSSLDVNLNAAFTNPGAVVTESAGLAGDGSLDILINGGGGSAVFNTTAAPVPEPASMALLGAGLFGLGMFRRRRT